MERSSTSGAVIGIAGALAIVGAYLAWAKVAGLGSFSGTHEEVDTGWYTLIAGVVLLLLAVLMFVQAARRWHGVVALLGGAIILFYAIKEIVDAPEGVGIGIGLWMTLVAGVLAAVGGIMVLLARPRVGMVGPPPAA